MLSNKYQTIYIDRYYLLFHMKMPIQPVYLRKPKIDPKTMVTLATREYPSKHHGSTARQTVIRNAQKSKTPPYLKV